MQGRLQYRGFSVARPTPPGWYLVPGEQSHTDAMFRRDTPADGTYSAFVNVALRSLPRAATSEADFAQLARQDGIADKQRFTVLSYHQKPIRVQGQWAIEYDVTVRDTGAPMAGGQTADPASEWPGHPASDLSQWGHRHQRFGARHPERTQLQNPSRRQGHFGGSSGRVRSWSPGGLTTTVILREFSAGRSEQGVEVDEQLPHDGGQRDLGGLALVAELFPCSQLALGSALVCDVVLPLMPSARRPTPPPLSSAG